MRTTGKAKCHHDRVTQRLGDAGALDILRPMASEHNFPLDELCAAVLPAWADVERRGAQLLLVVPLFGGVLLAGAYFGVPETPVPTFIVLAAISFALLYLARARQRLQKLPVWVLGASVRRKHMHQSTHSTTRTVTRRHYLELDVAREFRLSRRGQLTEASVRDRRPKLSTSTEIYGHVLEGDEIAAIVMPHDGAIYFIFDKDGRLFPVPARVAG